VRPAVWVKRVRGRRREYGSLRALEYHIDSTTFTDLRCWTHHKRKLSFRCTSLAMVGRPTVRMPVRRLLISIMLDTVPIMRTDFARERSGASGARLSVAFWELDGSWSPGGA
jgi:hypothetical protein